MDTNDLARLLGMSYESAKSVEKIIRGQPHDPMVVFGMNGDNGVSEKVEKQIRSRWIKDFQLANKVEFRRGDDYSLSDSEFVHKSVDIERWGNRESYCSSLVNVRGADVHFFQSFATDVNETVDEKLLSAILFAHSLKKASCSQITLFATMLPYARMDLKDRPRGPLSSQAVAIQLEAAGIDRVITMDSHNVSATQNAFRIKFDNLEARGLLAREVSKHIPRDKEVVVLAPDEGGQKRTLLFIESLEQIIGRPVEYASGRKRRDPNTGRTKLYRITTDVPLCGRYLILFDDIIDSGGTILNINENLKRNHSTQLDAVVVTHGLFSAKPEVLESNLHEIPRIWITDTVPSHRIRNTSIESRVEIVDTSYLWASALKCTRLNGSISSLLSRSGVRED